MVSQPAPVWKQEVNRRLAAHKSRKGSPAAEPQTPSNRPDANNRATLVAARVMARYAKTPSFSQMQAAEARAARRPAECARRAPVAAPALAPSPVAAPAPVLAEPREIVCEPEIAPEMVPAFAMAAEPAPCVAELPDREPAPVETPAPQVRWEQDIPVRPPEVTAFRDTPESRTNGWREPVALGSLAIQAADPVNTVEPDLPIPANLIEFPRELVATRKVRPRLAEGPFARTAPATSQLSIFEVDPETISNQPEPVAAAPAIEACEWSGIRLDAHPEPKEDVELIEEPAPVAAAIDLAPLSRRLLAAVVDGSLITGAFLAASWAALFHMEQLPATKPLEIAAALSLAATAVLYMALFSAFSAGTPGMKYAGISLCTFDDQFPTCAQRCGRLAAFLLSLLPVGLGLAWALFDEDHLSWHDRLSKTYQRH